MSPLRAAPGQDWQLDPVAREIVRGGRRTRLAAKPFLVLQALVEARGEVVTRAALRQRLWPDDTFVDFDNNLNSAVATLRHVLAERLDVVPTCIETIPRVGYRLVVPPESPVEAEQEAASIGACTGRERRVPIVPAAAAVLALCTLAALAALLMRPTVPAPGAAASSTSDREARALFERGTYLRGRFLASAPGRPSDLTAAREAFAAAARLDPHFTAAAAEEAETLVEMSFAGLLGFRDGLEQARGAVRRALERDARNAAAARVSALTALFLDWDFAAARRLLDRAARESPDARTAIARATWLAAAGRYDEAVAAAERAVTLDPSAYYVRADLAMFYLAAARDGDAVESTRRVLDAASEFAPAHAYALIAHERRGEWREAARHARALLRASGAPERDLARAASAEGRDAVLLWRKWDLARLERAAEGRRADYALHLALQYGVTGDREAALRELREALARRNPLLVLVRSYPELAGLRGDPAFERIARAVSAAPPGSAGTAD